MGINIDNRNSVSCLIGHICQITFLGKNISLYALLKIYMIVRKPVCFQLDIPLASSDKILAYFWKQPDVGMV